MFQENKPRFDGKSRNLTHFVAFEEHYGGQVSRKTVAKSFADGCILQFSGFTWGESITIQQGTVNISVFIEQRNFCNSKWYFAKNHEIGSLVAWREKLKNRESQGRIVSLDQLDSRRAITDLFVMFIAWTRQKASNVHKLLSEIWPWY